MPITDYWLNHALEVMRRDNLVYLLTGKNGSTYYSQLMADNQWNMIEFKDIDWETDHVFSFIQDPVERYLKGIAEDAWRFYDPNLVQALRSILFKHSQNHFTLLSVHSMPLSMLYKDYVYSIDWIPLHAKPNSEFFFKKICAKHGIDVEIDPNTYRHDSQPEKLAMYQDFKKILGEFNHSFYKIHADDIDLYTAVCQNFNPENQDWDQISWLKSQS